VYILAAHFRDQLIAASLKRAKAYSDRRGSRQFPRSTDRGLIEARFATPTRVGGPTHFRDQLIAASLKHFTMPRGCFQVSISAIN